MGRALAAGVVIGWWALCTAQYLPVWNTPVALATHAMTHAPAKPRTLILYGAMIVLQGRLADATVAFRAAGAAATLPHVPLYDKRRADEAVRDNLQAVATLDARTRGTAWPVPASY